jgi:DNA polymerase III gamma/tau subunit
MLTKKYRPRKIGQVIGQPVACEVAKTIVKDPQKRNSTYLFHGPSGTGKSTLAWMIAKALCPDGSGIVHINAANDNGVDASREIIRGLSYKNLGGGMKVFIIEEAQRITSSAQEIFLDDLDSDNLEDVLFIFTTTDVGSFVKGFKTRATYVKFNPILDEEILKRLKDIVQAENLSNVSDVILEKIVASSYGSARQAIKLLELCSSVSSEEEALSAIDITSGEDSEITEDVYEICRIIANPKRYPEYHKAIHIAYHSSMSPDSIRCMICNYINKCIVKSPNNKKMHNLGLVILMAFSNTANSKSDLTRMIMEICLVD